LDEHTQIEFKRQNNQNRSKVTFDATDSTKNSIICSSSQISLHIQTRISVSLPIFCFAKVPEKQWDERARVKIAPTAAKIHQTAGALFNPRTMAIKPSQNPN
jgi:hypothetical protein